VAVGCGWAHDAVPAEAVPGVLGGPVVRRLRVGRTERRTSAAARMRAHLLALGAWAAAWGWGERWRPTAVMAPGEAVRCRTRLMRRDAAAEGWAAAARRWG
jgi:hypothetical protein